MSWWKNWKPKVLCLGSGGIKGLDELGAIWWFWSENVLSDVDTYIGCSVGGIIGALMVIGYWPHEILTWAIDTTLFKDVSEIQVTGLAQDYGLVTNRSFDDALARRLKTMIVNKFGRVPTLGDLYEITGKTLILTVVSLKEESEIYVSNKTHPDMDLMTALRATSSTPFIFGKLEHQKDYLSDGALTVPLPISHLDDGLTPILAIGVEDCRSWTFEKIDIMKYFDRLTSLPLKKLTKMLVANASKACYTVIVPVRDEMGMIESSTREARMSKFLSGYHYTASYVLSHVHNAPTKIEIGEPPLSKEMLIVCLKSNAGRSLIRCMKENPDLLNECLSEMGVPKPKHHLEKIEDPEEDVIEIPRMEPRFHPMGIPRDLPMFNTDQIIIPITPEIRRGLDKLLNVAGGLFLNFFCARDSKGRLLLP